MAILSRLYPSASVVGLLAPQVQEVDFSKYVGNITNFGNMATEAAYITAVTNINSETQIGQQWGKGDMARQTYTLGQIQASFYRINAFVEYDVSEQAKFEALSNGVALPDFLQNLAEQGIYQRVHEGILFGFDPATDLNQGILANATVSALPADSANKTTLTGYNTAELQQFLSSIVADVMSASYGMLRPITIASSARTINYLKSAIVPLTESQQTGAGVDTVGGLFGRVVNWLGAGPVEFIQDNLLEDDVNGDKIVFVARGLDEQNDSSKENLVGKYNSIRYNTWYDEGEGLQMFDTPVSYGTYSSKLTYKMTPGVTLRSEAVRVVTAPYA